MHHYSETGETHLPGHADALHRRQILRHGRRQQAAELGSTLQAPAAASRSSSQQDVTADLHTRSQACP